MAHRNPEDGREYQRRYYQEHKAKKVEYGRRWREANRGRSSAAHRQRLYGVTPELFVEMWEAQAGVCANPGCDTLLTLERRGVFIDHDHRCCPGQKSCGQCVRGLLCNGCNVAVGMGGDDPVRLRGLADYLEAHPLKPKAQTELDL